LARTVDRLIVHGIAHDRRTLFAKSSAWEQKLMRLEAETYVTNKASATPQRNYAPQSMLKYLTSFDFGR
jgi:hypothetical protein